MISKFSKEFQKYFLLTFTKELIQHSEKREIANLQRIVELKEEKITSLPKRVELTESIFSDKKFSLNLTNKFIPKRMIATQKSFPMRQMRIPFQRSTISIPEPKLPPHLEYLKPIPRENIGVDLFKITPLINDQGVRIINATPDEKVIVIGTMGTKPTNIILNKEDINRIINKFSELSKIPVNEGIYRVVVGNLILSAIVSDILGSKFVIKKLIAPKETIFPNQQRR